MIIKSMGRSSKRFGTLYNYLTRDEEFELYTHNLYANAYDRKRVIKEFLENSSYIDSSRGKNYFYHEILSLQSNSNLSIKKQKEILFDLAQEYIKQRANEHLVLQAIHTDKKHTHLHLMISANKMLSNKRERLTQKEFATIQKDVESYQNSKYPYLESKHYEKSMQKDISKSKRAEQEIKHNKKKQTKKEQVKESIKDIFEKATSKTSLENMLKNSSYEIYTRGKNIGVVHEGKKYRLNTLNLDKSYKLKLREFELKKAREMRREEYKEAKKSQNNQKSRKEQLREDRAKQQQQSKTQEKSNESSKTQSKSNERSR
jgi:hypothetical protein